MLIQLVFLVCCASRRHGRRHLQHQRAVLQPTPRQPRRRRSSLCATPLREVVEADQTAVIDTLQQYHLSFLASNETYATFEEVLHFVQDTHVAGGRHAVDVGTRPAHRRRRILRQQFLRQNGRDRVQHMLAAKEEPEADVGEEKDEDAHDWHSP